MALDDATLLLDCFAPGRRGPLPRGCTAPTSKRRSLPGRSRMPSSPTQTRTPSPAHSGSPSSSTGLGEGDARRGSAFRKPLTVPARLLDSPSKIGRSPRSLALPADRSANGTRGVVSRGGSGPGRARMWDDVVYTCRHQRPFCSESCVSNGLRTNGNRRDYVLDLDPCGGSRGAGTTAGWNAATPAASRRQRGST